MVTRPAGQATHLAEALVDLGAQPVLYPVLAIEAVNDPTPILDAAIRLDQYDWAMFVSPNAVRPGTGGDPRAASLAGACACRHGRP